MVVPSDRTLLHWQGKFDLLSMLWSRETLATSTDLVDRHLSADGSPQAGYHFLCAREDVFSTADSIMDSGELSAFAFCTRSMVPSLLVLGCSNVAGTVVRIVHILLLEAGPNIDKRWHQVRSWLSDQSKERHVANAPASIIRSLAPRGDMTSVAADSDEVLFSRRSLHP